MSGEFGNPWLVIGLVIMGLLAVWLVLSLLSLGVLGAIVIFAFAAAQGFVGIISFVAAWVFLFPVMAIASFIVGFIAWLAEPPSEERITKRQDVRPTKRKPPTDPHERKKWANRLPPYENDY